MSKPTKSPFNGLGPLKNIDFLKQFEKYAHILLKKPSSPSAAKLKKNAVISLRNDIKRIHGIDSTNKQVIKRISNVKQRLKTQLEIKKSVDKLYLHDRLMYNLIKKYGEEIKLASGECDTFSFLRFLLLTLDSNS